VDSKYKCCSRGMLAYMLNIMMYIVTSLNLSAPSSVPCNLRRV
jgi:hypothetical protein